MSQCVAFSTPGLIPLEAFTAFGVHAKPCSTNPFGIFGTGLKYAIAVCLREGQEVVLWRGYDKYTFYAKKQDFRGKELDYVRMKRERWSLRGMLGAPKYTALPFTLELGKGWELWQAFRELEANTRDENGQTELRYWEEGSTHAHSNRTLILVFGSKFIDEYHERGRTFLPDGAVVRENEAVQVIDRPSRHVYYRGVRVMDLQQEAEYTYNFLKSLELTEDRTVKYPFMVESELVKMIAQSEDEDFVGRTVGAPSGKYENTLYYGYHGGPVSKVFASVAQVRGSSSAKSLVEANQPQVPSTTKILITVPRSEVSEDELEQVQIAVAAVFSLDWEGLKTENTNTHEEVSF